MRPFKVIRLILIGLLSVSLWSCAGSSSDSGGGGSNGDYRFLYDHNAQQLDGHTIRWDSNTIKVYTGGIPGAESAVNRWAGPVNFRFCRLPPFGRHLLFLDRFQQFLRCNQYLLF